ncbi:MAG: hypothetical protein JWN76_3811 [Chitinophagaceae bacterium]|nr:hypothetical protein [Chitinophagaceae bacterium]
METFTIPVIYNGTEQNFEASLEVFGYTHKIRVEVNGTPLFFEPDEERNYRALIPYDQAKLQNNIDKKLVTAIGEALERIINN